VSKGCPSDEICRPTSQPAECSDAGAKCIKDPYGYGRCN
jgi:hypothetical protein